MPVRKVKFGGNENKFAAAAQNFSADTVFQNASGRSYQGKVHRADNMVRSETFAPSPSGNSMFLIVDLEKQVSYTINDRQKFVMVAHGRPELGKVGMMIPGGVDPCAPAPGSDQKQFTCRQVGEETVNGRHALKLQITETKNGRTVTRMAWFDPKLRAILKIDIGDSTIMKLQNIQEAPQPARLFVVPDDYRRMDGGSGPIPIPQH